MNLFFSKCFLYIPKLTVFFGNQQQSNARAGQKKTPGFFGNARPKSNARAHLKQRKKPYWPQRLFMSGGLTLSLMLVKPGQAGITRPTS